jgi:hypothetical protein
MGMNGKARPGKCLVDVNDTGQLVMVQFWDDKIHLLAGLNMDDIATTQAQVEVRATFAGEYMGEVRYKPESIKVLGSAPQGATTAPKSAPQSASTPSMDQNQMRIMRQSTLHYASILTAPMVKDFETPQHMVEKTIELAGILLEYVISGENPYAEAEESSDPDIEQL